MIEKVNGNMMARIFAIDLKGRNDEKTIKSGVTSAWLSCLVDENSNLNDESIYFRDAIDLIYKLKSLAKKSKENEAKHICCYCFDLAFVWSFLYPLLISLGFNYEQSMDIDSENKCCCFANQTSSIVWSCEIKFGSNDGMIFLKDISRVYTGFSTIYEMAKGFGINREFYEEDLDIEHPLNQEPTPMEYVDSFSSAMTIMDILKKQEGNAPFFQSVTLASYSFKSMLKKTFGWSNSAYVVFRSKKLYPQIENEEEEKAIRDSIFGGLSGPSIYNMNNEIIKNDIFVIDARQMYPSVMCNFFMPCGLGEHHDGEFRSHAPNLSLYRVLIKGYDYPIIHSIPYLMQKAMTFIYKPIEIWMWDFELFLALRCYKNFKYEIKETWSYKGRKVPWDEYLKSNWESRCIADENNDIVSSNHFKACNNVIFGKLIQKTKVEDYETILDANEIMTTISKVRKNQKKCSYSYAPLGSCITARGRYVEIMMALRFGAKNIYYMDTDSLFIKDTKETRDILKGVDLGKHLGGWKLTEGIEEAFFPMAKRYKYKTKDGNVVKASGITFKSEDLTEYDKIKLTEGTIKMRVRKPIKGGTVRIKIEKNLG